MAFLHATAHASAPTIDNAAKKRSLTPYLLLLPGMVWLIGFFVLPIATLASTSPMTRPEGAAVGTYVQSLRFQNYFDAFNANKDQFFRSFLYAGIATLLALAISYPLAYMIAEGGDDDLTGNVEGRQINGGKVGRHGLNLCGLLEWVERAGF